MFVVKDLSHLFVDSERGKELQWAKKGYVVWPCSMFTEITQNVNSAEQLWRTTMYFAFLDHVNNEFERRFPEDQRQMMLDQ